MFVYLRDINAGAFDDFIVHHNLCTYIQAGVEQNVSESLSLAQKGIDQDDNWIIFNVFVHWLLARLLHGKKEHAVNFNTSC